jgi:hypothetical protein
VQSRERIAAHDRLKGRDPHDLTLADFAALGHHKRPPLDVIRQNCIECASGRPATVRTCQLTQCPAWPYRLTYDPFRKPMSEELRKAAGERLRKHQRQPENPPTNKGISETAEGSR